MERIGTIWEHNKLRLFISHTHPHKRDVGAQKLAFDALGVHAFVAHDDIEPSLAWQAVIEEALATCDAMVAWLTPDFHDSKWTDQEIGACLTRAIQIVPVRCGLDPYGFIGKFQALPAVGKPPFDVTQEIVEALARNGNTAARFLGPAAQAFACSRSYEIARATFKTLILLPEEGWTEEHLTVLEQAPGRNNQIEECIYERQRLPDVLREFIALRRRRAGLTPITVSSGAAIECRGDVEKINDVLTPNNRVFRNNRTVWLYVKNQGQTSEFSARFWNVQGLPYDWGTNYGVRHVSWEGGRPTTRPEIDGYGGERRVKVANVALSPLAFWFYTTENGLEECGTQLLLSELYPDFNGHNIMIEIEIVNQGTGEKLFKTGYIYVPPSGEPRFSLRDSLPPH